MIKPKLAAPCSVERTHRSVIERKLLTALEDENTVAALFSKQDLEDIIAALLGYVLSHTKGNTVSWEAHLQRRKELADSMSQLLREAFPSSKPKGTVPKYGHQIGDTCGNCQCVIDKIGCGCNPPDA